MCYLNAQELEVEAHILQGKLQDDTHLLEHDAGERRPVMDLDDVEHEERYDEEEFQGPEHENNNVINKEYVDKLRQLHRKEVLIS